MSSSFLPTASVSVQATATSGSERWRRVGGWVGGGNKLEDGIGPNVFKGDDLVGKISQ